MLLQIHCMTGDRQQRPTPKEGIMILSILLSSLFIVLLAVGAVTLQPWESRRHVLNAEWLDDADKFELITRWGLVG